ncbi:hypothetical protein ANCCAN_09892 [Ancylostoma caninum]|uniref:Uncharacterized protein n=1 Tax=Ancylostoma caninum TaxID=29170 RepID=A0A368GKA9_ANCCA|nr:hypothetical protein ANCCAN_09892 [Ancylostoma caninum]
MAPDTDFEEAQAALKSLRAKTLAQIDYPTTAAASYGEPVDSAVESFGSKELPVEQQESSGEQKLTTTGSHADVEFSSPDSEGSGQDELNRSVEKVSGEVGQYSPDEHPSTYGEMAYDGQQHSVRGTAAAPGYDDTSNDGYSSVISQPSTTLSDSGYDSMAQSTTMADVGYDGVPQNTIIPEQGYGAAPQTTVMPDVGYEGAGQNTIPQGAGYDVVAQSTPVPELNYDRAPQSSSYGVPQTPGYEEVPQYSSSYSYTAPDESSKTTASITEAYSPVDRKQLQDFSEAVKERSDNDQAVVSPPISKKISSSNEADASKKYKEEAPASTSTTRKSALIGPPADRAPPRRGAVEGTCSIAGAHAHNELPLPY